MNVNTSRWIITSITEYFRAIASSYISFYSEDEDKDTSKETDWVELRVNGPEYKETSKGYFTIYVNIDLLITVHLTKANISRIHELAGLFETSCNHIPIYRYGDDDTFVFCLTLDTKLVSNVKKVYLGHPTETRLKRASVMAFYENIEQLE